jgi:predicted TIM-barrel fold metal-dependent hydrolase
MGGDWPVIILGDDYAKVWKAQVEVTKAYTPEQQEWFQSKTAKKVYNL